jgi:hypothetical protein
MENCMVSYKKKISVVGYTAAGILEFLNLITLRKNFFSRMILTHFQYPRMIK